MSPLNGHPLMRLGLGVALLLLFGPAAVAPFGNRARHTREVSDERLRVVSPVTYLTADDPPVLILPGDQDRRMPLAQSEAVVGRCEEPGLACTLHVIEGAGHGGRAFSDEERYAIVKAFRDERVKGRGP